MTTNSKTVSNGRQGSKGTGFHNSLVYIRQHWQLYVIFMMPGIVTDTDFQVCAYERYTDCFSRLQSV